MILERRTSLVLDRTLSAFPDCDVLQRPGRFVNNGVAGPMALAPVRRPPDDGGDNGGHRDRRSREAAPRPQPRPQPLRPTRN